MPAASGHKKLKETDDEHARSTTRRTTVQALGVGAAALAMPAVARAQAKPVRIGYAIARTGPWPAARR